LGSGRVARGQHRPFKKARAFVRGLGLKSNKEWSAYCRSGKKPPDIPTNPSGVYAKAGWVGFGDWLGTGTVASYLREFRSFEKGRAFVRGLGLMSVTEWRAFCESGKKPPDIPANPQQTYAKAGWAGYDDWLGTGRVGPGRHRTFNKARAFVRGLGLTSVAEWRGYCRSGKKELSRSMLN
jgi:hypothetical protein